MAGFKRKEPSSSIDIHAKLKELGLEADPDYVEEKPNEDEQSLAPSLESLAAEAEDAGYDPLAFIEEEETPETSAEAIKRSNLRDALFDDSIKPPKRGPGRPRKNESETQEAQNSESFEYTTEAQQEAPEPVYMVPQQRVRAFKPIASPAVKKLGAVLSKKLPGAERIKIKKRLPNGTLGIIGEYSASDLAASSDIESFILRYIKPEFGAGVYKLTGIDAAGNELEAGEIPVLEPEKEKEGNHMNGVVQQLINLQKEISEQKMAPPSPVQNPLEMIKGLHEMQKDMTPKDDSGNVMAAMMASQSQQMQMFMQMMAQQSAQTMQMMVTALQPKEDPMMKMLLAKLVEEKSSGGTPMPLPPPPPPSSSVKDIIEAVAALAPLFLPLLTPKKDDDSKELVKQLLAAKDEDRLKIRDVIDLMQNKSAPPGDDTFRKSMENMSMMLNVAQSMRQQNEGGGSSAGFFDALGALFSNRDFGASIAQSMRASTEMKQQAAAAQARKEHLLALAQARQQQILTANTQPPVRAVPPVQHVAPVQQIRPQQVLTTPPPAPTAAVEQVPQQASEGNRLPPFPKGITEHLNGLLDAKDDAELLQKTAGMFVYFYEFEEWQPLMIKLLSLVQSGEQKKAVTVVAFLFSEIAKSQLMTMDLASKIVKTFHENFDHVQAGFADLPLPQPDMNPVEEALANSDDGDEEDDSKEDEEDSEEDDDEGEGGATAASA